MIYQTRPTSVFIRTFVESFNKNNSYENENYLAAIKLISAFPKNDKYKDIFIKVNFINGAFKTAIGDTFGVAKQIFEKVKNIDSRLKKGDKTLIEDIAKYESVKTESGRRNFSFATKFCHCHYPDYFPINDKYVRNSLAEFNKYLKFSKFTKASLLNYDIFLSVLDDFREVINDHTVNNTTIDRFLWALGKQTEKNKSNI